MSERLHPMPTHRRYTTGETGFRDLHESATTQQRRARPRTTSCIELSESHAISIPFTSSFSNHYEAISTEKPRRSRCASNNDLPRPLITSNTRTQLSVVRKPVLAGDGLLPTSLAHKHVEAGTSTTRLSYNKLHPRNSLSHREDSAGRPSSTTTTKQSTRRERQMDVLLKTGIFEAQLRAIINRTARIAVTDVETSLKSSEVDESVSAEDPPSNLGDYFSGADDQPNQLSELTCSLPSSEDSSTEALTPGTSTLTNSSQGSAQSRFTQQSATGPSSRLSKESAQKKRKHSEDNDEDEDVPDRRDRNQQSEPATQPNGNSVQGFACHFNKYNSEKYCQGSNGRSSYKACTNRFPSTGKIEQHFKEVHCYGDLYCPRCLRILRNEDEFEEHLRRDRLCAIIPQHTIDGELYLIRGSQRRKNLKMLGKKSPKKTSPEERWRQIWEALFPGVPCPSPYRAPTHEEHQFQRGLAVILPSLGQGQPGLVENPDSVTDFPLQHDQMLGHAGQLWEWFQENEEGFGESLEDADDLFPGIEEGLGGFLNGRFEQDPVLFGLGDPFNPPLEPIPENPELSTSPPTD